MKSYQMSIPKTLIERLRLLFPPAVISSILHAFTIRRPTTLRANTLKISGPLLRRQMMEMGVKLDTVFWYKDAFIVRNRLLKDLKELKYYQEGYFYVQSLSSMLPALVLNPKPGEKVLDMAAAPGSKTTQIAAMMKNKGEIVANEPNPVRRQKLEANLKVQGVTNIKIISIPGEIIHKHYDGYFDKVLIDAPCSGEGRITQFNDNSYKHWSLRNVKLYSSLQKKLLISSLLAVRPGGTVTYSTCTLSLEENEEVVSSVLEKAKGLVRTEPVHVNSMRFVPPIMSWEGKVFHPGVGLSVRVYPSALMEGFFIASFRRVG